MTPRKSSIFPLIAVTLVHLLCILAAARWFQMGLASAPTYQGDGGFLPTLWAVIAGPLVMTIAALSATMLFWRRGRRGPSYALSAGLFVSFLAIVTLFRAPAP